MDDQPAVLVSSSFAEVVQIREFGKSPWLIDEAELLPLSNCVVAA